MDLKKKTHEELLNFIVSVGWTHKIHIVQSDIYNKKASCFRIWRVCFSAATSSGLVAIILLDVNNFTNLLTGLTSFAAFAMLGLDKSIDYNKFALEEKKIANKFCDLKDQGTTLLFETKYNIRPIDEIQKDVAKLNRQRSKLNDELPNPSRKAVLRASKQIKEQKDNDYSEDYKYFIPKQLINLEEE